MTTALPRVARRRTVAPSLAWERAAWRAGKLLVAGVDEVGRGAWAGPLTAGAVLLPLESAARARLTRTFNKEGLTARDSKQLSSLQREQIVHVLHELAIPCAVVDIPADEIDTVGLGVANRFAMCRAAAELQPLPEHVLVDAFTLGDLHCSHDAIVRGDARCLSIALASIVAKVHRDALMVLLHEHHPEYGFADHKGYGTAAHAAALARFRVTPWHRRSFAPIAALLFREPMTADERHATGEAGEAYVAGRLEREGYQILQRNWRIRGGEIDIVALDGDELVFVEVRVRRGQVGDAEGSVASRKLATLMRAGQRYVEKHVAYEDHIWRVDLVSIDLAPDRSIMSYQHYQNLTRE